MTQVLRVFDHYANLVDVARQDYELSIQEVEDMLSKGHHRIPQYTDRFQSAVNRRDIARKRWLKTIGAY